MKGLHIYWSSILPSHLRLRY